MSMAMKRNTTRSISLCTQYHQEGSWVTIEQEEDHDNVMQILRRRLTGARRTPTSLTSTSTSKSNGKTEEEGRLTSFATRTRCPQKKQKRVVVLVALISLGLFSLLAINQHYLKMKLGLLNEFKGGRLPPYNSTSITSSSYSSLAAVSAGAVGGNVTRSETSPLQEHKNGTVVIIPVSAVKVEVPVLRQQTVVVSMKTIPSRIKYIEPTLQSLLVNQTMPLDRLYIILPKETWMHKNKVRKVNEGEDKNQEEQQRRRLTEEIQYNIPNFLQALIQRDERVVILRPQYDFGPVDKMLYTLEELEKESAANTSMTTNTSMANANLIYLDDDVIYDQTLVQNLVQKGIQYPDSVVAFSGCTLRNHFRQIKHQFPRSRYDRHPNLYYTISGTESLPKDEIVDIVQGFMGVLVRPQFFHPIQDFIRLVQNVTDRSQDGLLWKSDDYIISAYLEQKNVTRRVVVGGVPPNINAKAAGTDNLGKGMHRQVMHAAYELQHRLDIWHNLTFVNYMSLAQHPKDLIDCEAGDSTTCEKVTSRSAPTTSANATKILDKLLL